MHESFINQTEIFENVINDCIKLFLILGWAWKWFSDQDVSSNSWKESPEFGRCLRGIDSVIAADRTEKTSLHCVSSIIFVWLILKTRTKWSAVRPWTKTAHVTSKGETRFYQLSAHFIPRKKSYVITVVCWPGNRMLAGERESKKVWVALVMGLKVM